MPGLFHRNGLSGPVLAVEMDQHLVVIACGFSQGGNYALFLFVWLLEIEN